MLFTWRSITQTDFIDPHVQCRSIHDLLLPECACRPGILRYLNPSSAASHKHTPYNVSSSGMGKSLPHLYITTLRSLYSHFYTLTPPGVSIFYIYKNTLPIPISPLRNASSARRRRLGRTGFRRPEKATCGLSNVYRITPQGSHLRHAAACNVFAWIPCFEETTSS